MQIIFIICLIFIPFGCDSALKDATCGFSYRGVGLCKMLITKIVYIPIENKCRVVHITGCSATGTFFSSVKACEAKCKK
ncbi:uncharacterized protein LOC128262026 [Drosophila gunungcola]|uniref:BPTI/Kunitz inhibitor domain-containing protein n=1 Tax=Drosophila gunungcola TaxID=103775 RepID=A0A9P9YS63_9MUSC|nr:uncharacterized protein LOC128262026 [Drosophila gunungcola]KAI8042175.1 hypothetical protein M5D96_003477 [Drosophila gunungcola]